MVVDGQWVTIVAFLDKGMATRMTEIFRDDLTYTRQVTYEEWQRDQL